ncbi:hypothetical protein HYPSUDRAFT_303179 [Hypholoma sublateritium FD-334 SS-4]|uniref:Uncharacterized protein n=1 Tax=Hypholoma sublateritium (strain FD-334 SS-4) TaxID=945553 RepID=A0A0D2KNN8_HYPSF|nr:hypothetical protein HYPSUDRAFT_303179 [Hypholoma sublateritium FD-334 SS-4]
MDGYGLTSGHPARHEACRQEGQHVETRRSNGSFLGPLSRWRIWRACPTCSAAHMAPCMLHTIHGGSVHALPTGIGSSPKPLVDAAGSTHISSGRGCRGNRCGFCRHGTSTFHEIRRIGGFFFCTTRGTPTCSVAPLEAAGLALAVLFHTLSIGVASGRSSVLYHCGARRIGTEIKHYLHMMLGPRYPFSTLS